VTPLPARSEHVGHTQAVWRMGAGSDPRADGRLPMLPR